MKKRCSSLFLSKPAIVFSLFFAVLSPAQATMFDFSRVVKTGDPVPESDGFFFDQLFPPALEVFDSTALVTFVGDGSNSAGETVRGIFQATVDLTNTFSPSFERVIDTLTFNIDGRIAVDGTDVAFIGSPLENEISTSIFLSSLDVETRVAAPVVSLFDPIPFAGGEEFLEFGGFSLSNGQVAFVGRGSTVEGVYIGSLDMPVERVADTSVAVPDGSGPFVNFDPVIIDGDPIEVSPVIRDGTVAFFGEGSFGVYIRTPDGRLSRVADTTTEIPDGLNPQNFRDARYANFGPPAFDAAGNVGFFGLGGPGIGNLLFVRQGIYKKLRTAAGPVTVADTRRFGGFSPIVSIANGNVAFIAFGSTSLFTDLRGVAEEIIGTDDILNDMPVGDLSISNAALSSSSVAFLSNFAMPDQPTASQGIFVATAAPLPAPGSVFLLSAGLLVVVGRRV